MRTLWWVPTRHLMRETPLEGLAPPTPEAEKRHILAAWKKVKQALDRHLASGALQPRGMLMFVDGVPHLPKQSPKQVWGWRSSIEPLTLLLRWLQRKGAELQGTEDFCLVLAQMWALLDTEMEQRGIQWVHEHIVARRDRYIARRIARLVPEGGSAILFMGQAHRVHRRLHRLAPDFQIRRIRAFDDVFKKYSS